MDKAKTSRKRRKKTPREVKVTEYRPRRRVSGRQVVLTLKKNLGIGWPGPLEKRMGGGGLKGKGTVGGCHENQSKEKVAREMVPNGVKPLNQGPRSRTKGKNGS